MNKNNLTIQNGSVTTPEGYKASGIHCLIKQSGPDLALIASDMPCNLAAMFTTNRVPAPCILIDKERAKQGQAQAIVINSGNANACTGEQGFTDALEMIDLAARELNIDPALVLVANTGIIGHPMPMDLIRKAIPKSRAGLSANGGVDAAWAIMTTDTKPKHFSVTFELDGKKCSIGAIAKGSGMINPDMATMICIMTTNVNIEQPLLREALKEAVDISFNMLTVDGEMSTNDCIFLFANGLSGNEKISIKDKNYKIFLTALKKLSVEMAKAIVSDGEGATKLITVTAAQAASKQDAIRAAKAIANSNLVKTAIYGKDPNWGRIVQAVGASGAEIDPNNFVIRFADIAVAEKGATTSYNQELMQKALEKKEINIYAGLGTGTYSATVYTCDLTHDYITINADYHT
ncbi:bifunctional glutamate N-acetyltransferase/amino-acid acetyltransferase ArgJ [candidate division KSB1 bacterium]|nr:bifunctional glutamate N-acetyltransferase/amino-acid acetyltransferase ArgJ [candidate division KSB1 bacterium]